MTWEDLHPDLYGGAKPRVYVTDPDDPESGRAFVWAPTRWFERIVSATESGAVEFEPVAESDEELHDWLSEQNLDIDELDDEFAASVREEFLNEVPLYPDAEQESRGP